MNKLKFLILGGLIVLMGCADEDLAPIITFDSAGKGAYPALVESSGGEIFLDDLAGSTFNYTVEFVDLEKGALVSEYKTEVSFTDYDESDGNSSTGPVALNSYSTGDFSPQASGNVGVSSVTVTGADMAAKLGLTADDLKGGGQFDVVGTVTTVDGAVFRSTNSSAAVNGAAFRGFFDYTLFVICPSSLAGNYSAVSVGTSTDGCCPGEVTAMREDITLTDKGSGLYEINDFTGGIYFKWYGPDGGDYGITLDHGVAEIQDACGIIAFVTNAEPFGESLKGDGRVMDDGTLEFSWLTGYGDKAKVVLTPK